MAQIIYRVEKGQEDETSLPMAQTGTISSLWNCIYPDDSVVIWALLCCSTTIKSVDLDTDWGGGFR